ncbi:MAG TPA: Ig-like domain-containing protein [Candidatus Acidoferrales bacterium]|nr:Ig-like domain-containing protein [Candidatus Acidoferrales bacterium]
MSRHIRAPEGAPARADARWESTALTRATLAALLAAALAAGCAKKGPPTGGPPDLTAPTVLEVEPDSGAAGVSTHVRPSITFSKGMEPRSTNDALDFAPPVPIRQRRWSGNSVTLVLGDTLKADHTYTLYVGSAARDRRGNTLANPRAIVFTTSKTFPRGRLEGRVDAVGFRAASTTLWCYRDGRQPDSTARDFDALGVADAAGNFRIGGLSVPGRWRVWGFADLNHNRSFEPNVDLLVAADTTLDLTSEQPVATGIRLHMVNPKAPGRFAGVVIDSVSDGTGICRLIVAGVTDTTRRVVYEVPENNSFDFKWDPGTYRVRAFRDLDRNRVWKRDTEPASEEVLVHIEPGGEITGFEFVLARPVPLPPAPAPGAGP